MQRRRRNLNRNNGVIVRIWTSGHNKKIRGRDVGHVSLETFSEMKEDCQYMSLWPRIGITKKELLKVVPAEFKPNYQSDRNAEDDRDPGLEIRLYSVGVPQICDAFEEVQEDEEFKGWTLIGNNRL